MNTYEVEIKFRVSDVAELKYRLQQRFGISEFGEQVLESDSFFQHPCRNFVQTDECLRLRNRTLADDSSRFFLTYKGPKIDASTKTRQEIEMSVAEPECCERVLAALGFCRVASVQKFRRQMALMLEHRQANIVLDTLPALPESDWHFMEIEILATEDDVETCRSLILDLAQQLGLSEPIRDSYLKLVQSPISEITRS